MCYMARKCNSVKISVDMWHDSERKVEIDPNKSNNIL